MGIEQVYRHTLGQDFEFEPVEEFVTFVEGLTEKKVAYAVLEKTTGDATDEAAKSKELRRSRPIIGYGGPDTFPFISDPDQHVKGVFAIYDQKLIYSKEGIPLHEMRDGHIWGYSNPKYYIRGTFLEVVSAYLDKGYPLLNSDDLIDFQHHIPFTTSGKITFDEILEPQ